MAPECPQEHTLSDWPAQSIRVTQSEAVAEQYHNIQSDLHTFCKVEFKPMEVAGGFGISGVTNLGFVLELPLAVRQHSAAQTSELLRVKLFDALIW